MSENETGGDVVTKKKEETETKEPPRYKVIFFNDDFTTMEFVVRILESIFNKSPAEATQIMLRIHKSGRGVAGIYSREVAETKVYQTEALARREGHPLMVAMEPE